MSGIINTGSFPKRLWPGVLAWFGDAYNSFDMEYEKIFETMKSDKRFEDMTGLVGMGLATIQGEGDSVEYAGGKQGFTNRFTNVVYSKGFIITQLVQDDDQYAMNLSEQYSRALARSMVQTKETVGANVLNNAFSGSFLYGDGSPLISTSHQLSGVTGSTFSNRSSTDADLSEASLEQALIDIGGLVDDAGLKIKVLPKRMIIPRQLQFDARRILMSDYKVGSADNDINASKGFIPEGHFINHFLTDIDAWFIITDSPYGMIHMERSPYAITSDNDFDTDNAKFKASERYSFGVADPRGIYGSAGS